MFTKTSFSLLLLIIILPIYAYSAEPNLPVKIDQTGNKTSTTPPSEAEAAEATKARAVVEAAEAEVKAANAEATKAKDEAIKAKAEAANAEATKAKAEDEAEAAKVKAEVAKAEAAEAEAKAAKAKAEAANAEATKAKAEAEAKAAKAAEAEAKAEAEAGKTDAAKAKAEAAKAKAEAEAANDEAAKAKAEAEAANDEAAKAEAKAETAKVEAAKAEAAKVEAAKAEAEAKLDKFGFGPAFFVINYRDKVLSDSKDVAIKGDGTISSKGTQYVANFGFEVHYDFSFGHNPAPQNSLDHKDGYLVTGHVLSPFLGLYDISNGINGIAVGVMYGYKKLHLDGNGKETNGLTLNTGLGWTVHKNQLVLADGLKDGAVPAAALTPADYTTRKDVTGLTLMISANMGF